MKKLLIAILSVIMAMLMLVLGPIQTFAGSDTKVYIEDIIVVAAKDADEAKNLAGDDYIVMETPIYDGSSDTGDNTRSKKSFLCYKTTEDPKNAITEIKALNMNAPWDYNTYNNYIKELKTSIRKDVKSLCKSIEEFQWKFGSNTEDDVPYPKAQYAYEELQYLYDDDIVEHENKNLRECPRLGDLFLAFDFEDEDSAAEAEAILVDILLESNAQCVNIIYNALTLACSENEGTDFLDTISGKNFKAEIYKEAAGLNDYAVDIINTISETQNEIKKYETYGKLDESIFTVPEELSGVYAKLQNIIDYDKTHAEKYFDQYIKTVLQTDPASLFPAERRVLIEQALCELTWYKLNDNAFLAHLKADTYNDLYLSFGSVFDSIKEGKITVDEYNAKINENRTNYDNGIVTVPEEFGDLLKLYTIDLECYSNNSYDAAEIKIGKNLYNILKSCKYRGYESDGKYEYNTLYDLVMKHDMTGENEPKETYKPSDFYPIIAQLTDGQRGMLKTGILNLVLSVRVTSEQYKKSFDTLTELIKELAEGDCKIDGVDPDDPCYSIFGGIDRDLFKDEDSGVAMMKSAVDLSIQERDKAFALQSDQDKQRTLFTYMLIGFGAAAGALGVSAGVAFIVHLIADRVFMNAPLGESLWAGPTAIISNTVARVFGIVFAVAVIVLAVIGLVSALKNIWKKPETTKYLEIPKVVCNAESITTYYMNLDGNWSKKEDVGFVYYYGVKNPKLGDKEEDDSKNVIGENKVADVANWSQSGYRQWIALYYTKSLTAGQPILASSLEINAKSFVEGKRTVSMFSTGASCDMQMFLYGSPIKAFLHYAVDEDYKPYTNDTNGNANGAASIFAEPTTYIISGLGLILGIAGGCGITAFANKSKKNRKED